MRKASRAKPIEPRSAHEGPLPRRHLRGDVRYRDPSATRRHGSLHCRKPTCGSRTRPRSSPVARAQRPARRPLRACGGRETPARCREGGGRGAPGSARCRLRTSPRSPRSGSRASSSRASSASWSPISKPRIRHINDALLDLVGYTREEIESGARCTGATSRRPSGATTTGEPSRAGSPPTAGIAKLREKEYVRKDGARVPVLIGAAMLNRAEGTGAQVLAFVLDLTQKAQRVATTRWAGSPRARRRRHRSGASSRDRAPDAIWSSSTPRARSLFVNESGSRRCSATRPRKLVEQPIRSARPGPAWEGPTRETPGGVLSPARCAPHGQGAGAPRTSQGRWGVSRRDQPQPPGERGGLLVSSAIHTTSPERKRAEEQRSLLACATVIPDDAIVGKTTP